MKRYIKSTEYVDMKNLMDLRKFNGEIQLKMQLSSERILGYED